VTKPKGKAFFTRPKENAMGKRLGYGVAVGVLLSGWLVLGGRNETEAGKAQGALLSHDVYFTLTNNTAAAKQKLVAACKKYLSKHPGEVFFAAGTRAEDLRREVNDQDFNVALHIVFQSKAAQEQYQAAARHQQFIAENKDAWKKVRVFDSLVER
jgi:hypothetical protein